MLSRLKDIVIFVGGAFSLDMSIFTIFAKNCLSKPMVSVIRLNDTSNILTKRGNSVWNFEFVNGF